VTSDLPSSRQLQQSGLEVAPLLKRANAAVVDMSVVGVVCFGLLWTLQYVEPPQTRAATPFWIALGVLVLVELLFGWTAGKAMTRLLIRRENGQRAPILALAIRAIVRELPVLIFLACLFVKDRMLSLSIWGISLLLVCCYVCAVYILLFRNGKTPFDLAAGTVVVVPVRKET
jgi:uncharacterized RDD family membrane protein YckC